MFEDAQRMAALNERRRIIETLRKYVIRSGDTITLVNYEGDLGLVNKDNFYHLSAIFKDGNGQPTSA
jgi:hypothetical protein